VTLEFNVAGALPTGWTQHGVRSNARSFSMTVSASAPARGGDAYSRISRARAEFGAQLAGASDSVRDAFLSTVGMISMPESVDELLADHR